MQLAKPLTIIALIVCTGSACSQREESSIGSILYFQERDVGVDAYRTRMLVSDAYLRIDEGNDGGDFLLFDRRKNIIYSINSADRRTLVLHPRELAIKPPAEFRHRVETDGKSYPSVDSRTVRHYRLFTNDRLCFEVYAAEGLLTDTVQALKEYRQVLAGEQSVSQTIVPKEMQSACDLANLVFLPARHLLHGFPIRQVDQHGKSRELVDYALNQRIDSALFRLPPDFDLLTMQDMRGATNP